MNNESLLGHAPTDRVAEAEELLQQLFRPRRATTAAPAAVVEPQ